MTRARTSSYGVVTPPPLDRWIDAALMLFASLVQGVVTTFGMRRWIGQRDWHTHSGTSALPQTKPDIHIKESKSTDLQVRLPRDPSPEARRAQGEGGDPASAQRALPKRTALAPLIPTNVGIQGSTCAFFRPAASSLHAEQNRSWIPTFVGMCGATPSLT